MKRLLFVLLLSMPGLVTIAQPVMQASIGVGSTSSRIKVYVKPNAPVNGQIATMNFNVAISGSVTPTPTISITNNPFPGATFQINFTYTEAGYTHYNIANLNPFNMNIGAVETEILELSLNNGTLNSTTVSLVTLPDGGVTTPFALFYCTGAATSNGSGLYYARSGTTISNQFSYTNDPNFGTPPGTGISTAVLNTLISLPVKWLSFDVLRQNNDALINWSVSDEESNHHYEIQRSQNGADFLPISVVNKNGMGSGIHNYTYVDHGINLLGSPVIYYRLKQVDIDGKFSYSEIRRINLSLSSANITVYPNPVTDGFYVVIPGLTPNPGNTIKLLLTGVNGQLVQTREISVRQAANYFFDLKGLGLAPGNYYLQISRNSVILGTKKLLISRN